MVLGREGVLIGPDLSVREAVSAINRSGLAMALVVGSDRRLLGIVTDGDIRRAVLTGVDLTTSVSKIMNTTPRTVGPEIDVQQLRQILLDVKPRHVPIVDRDGKVLDLVSIGDVLSIPLALPDITNREIEAVREVLKTPALSLGPTVARFEKAVAAYAGRRHAVAVNSGTSGLHLLVRALGLGPGDEVITTPFSFIASSNCLLYEDVTPVFVDIDPDTYNIDTRQIEAAITLRTKAILTVDVFGQPARLDSVTQIAEAHELAVISDCCESIGAELQGRRASTYGVAGVFGFYPNKQITTGEGGAVVTDSSEIARLCRSMRNQGRSDEGGWLAYERLGFNYRLPDINCALGLVQIDRIESILASRQRVASMYDRLLTEARVPGIHPPIIDPAVTRMSWFVYVVRLSEGFTRSDRDFICQTIRSHGIGVNSYFPPIHLQPLYVSRFGFKSGQFPVTEHVAERTIALPFYNNLNEDDATHVVASLKKAVESVTGCRV